MLHACGAAGAGFLLAVLWFDLMFDVQVRRDRSGTLPDAVLDSISAYYRRVTTDASPMGRLVGVAMVATLAVLVAQTVTGTEPRLAAWLSLAAAASAVGLAAGRTVRNAARLGRVEDGAAERTRLARAIWRDHLYCLAAMAAVLLLQLAAAGMSG